MADLSNELAQYGIDYKDAMDRVGDNADFYKQLAMKYLDDSNYAELVAAMDAANYDDAYKAAHALKGVSGNLSLSDLYKASSAVSEALREGEYQAAGMLMPQVKEAHEKAVEGLAKWQDNDL